jgi:hypothetical protein
VTQLAQTPEELAVALDRALGPQGDEAVAMGSKLFAGDAAEAIAALIGAGA